MIIDQSNRYAGNPGFAFGPGEVFAFSQTLSPGSITSAEAWGSPVVGLQQTLSPGSITSAASWGSPVVAGPVIATSITSSESWGSPTAIVGGVILAGSITSAESWGSPVVAGPIVSGSIASAESWGLPVVAGPVIATSITSSESWGAPEVIGSDQLLIVGSIWSGPVFGLPTVGGGKQTLQLFLGGVNRTSRLRVASMSLDRQVKGRSAASFTLGARGTDARPVLGQTVQITELGEKIFIGCVNEIKETRYIGTLDQFTWQIQAVDKAAICDHRVATAKFLAGSLITDAKVYIVANFLNGEGISYDPVSDGLTFDDDIEFNLATVTECWDRICDITGEHWTVNVNAQLKFNTLATSPAAPWGLTDTGNSWRELSIATSLLDYRNKQYVRSSAAITG